jgi:hypothetical protein
VIVRVTLWLPPADKTTDVWFRVRTGGVPGLLGIIRGFKETVPEKLLRLVSLTLTVPDKPLPID